MTSNRRRTISLNQSIDDQIEFYVKNYGISVAEVNRLVWEAGTRNDRNLMRVHLQFEEEQLKTRLEEVKVRLEAINNEPPDNTQESVLDKYARPKVKKTQTSMTDEQIFQNYRSDIMKDTGGSEVIRRRIREIVEKHPDLEKELTPQEIERLRK